MCLSVQLVIPLQRLSPPPMCLPLPLPTYWASSWHFPSPVHSKTRGKSLQLISISPLFPHFHWVSWSAWEVEIQDHLWVLPQLDPPYFLTLFATVPLMELQKCFAVIEQVFFLCDFYAPLSLLLSLLWISFISPFPPFLLSKSIHCSKTIQRLSPLWNFP